MYSVPANQNHQNEGRELPVLMKQYFGFSTFRPFQHEIVNDSLAGRDVVALLPTGGGKSLCYQLRALAGHGLAIVVSPLIALMKDQVDSLHELGVPATFLNSSLSPGESSRRWRDLLKGKYKLLYLAPERLKLMLDWLERLNFTFAAIDEAHCISEWGHDFRPEYRELSLLRARFPGVPIMALTATATTRVRDDICRFLGLVNPSHYVASFNRPNLSYRVIARHEPLRQIEQILDAHKDESGIIYCWSRKQADEVAAALVKKGYNTCAYHAGLPAGERSKRQEKFINDEISVMVATIAFGMGIDKPDVRFVLHRDLPRNIESYYQETGRAGRDGMPGECILLYSKSDYAKQISFIEEITDPREKEIAGRQLGRLLEFAESCTCRRVELLRYFGETYRDSEGRPLDACGACDNCLTPRETFDGTLEAQKILSCVIRIRQMSGFDMGLQHLVDVLCGSKNEKIRRFEHDTLSTYGIGADLSRTEWLFYARELVDRGYLSVSDEKFPVVGITEKGRDSLRNREMITLRKPLVSTKLTATQRKAQRTKTGALDMDGSLFEKLRALRLTLAKERGIPAYMIFSDRTLQEMAADHPVTREALLQVSGVGEKKMKQYGDAFLRVLQ